MMIIECVHQTVKGFITKHMYLEAESVQEAKNHPVIQRWGVPGTWQFRTSDLIKPGNLQPWIEYVGHKKNPLNAIWFDECGHLEYIEFPDDKEQIT